jgi:hypothetical protein
MGNRPTLQTMTSAHRSFADRLWAQATHVQAWPAAVSLGFLTCQLLGAPTGDAQLTLSRPVGGTVPALERLSTVAVSERATVQVVRSTAPIAERRVRVAGPMARLSERSSG